ncbi:hypothetical protein DBV05_g1210 [Lasiodiplodia theobromae]|uniref:Uncharacterized protein n=1 Tax=Lasiodiplodia theobromae TaxID=45133 RepID=A0A5N5DQX1_9PEZI|nr:hypothetical protein DBV05_g1210 [Lasiodiplodia theobromae]
MSEASDRIFSLIQRAVSKIAGYGDRITVLSPTRTPAAEKQRRHFIRVFVRRLADFAASERAKYPADPLSPPPPLLETNCSDDDYDSANPCILTPAIDATLGDLMSRTGADGRGAAGAGLDGAGVVRGRASGAGDGAGGDERTAAAAAAGAVEGSGRCGAVRADGAVGVPGRESRVDVLVGVCRMAEGVTNGRRKVGCGSPGKCL